MAAMKRPVWIVAGVVVLGALVLWLALREPSENVVVSFVDSFPEAVEKRPDAPDTFTISDVTLAGVTKRAIVAKNPSRIAWSVTIPENARLVLSAGIREEGWTVARDGVSFRASLNDDEVLNLLVDAYGDASARRWHDVEVDLSEFAGETMNVFLKTFTGRTADGDLPVWGEPRIVTR
jgi:hypothetical protein